MNGFEIWLIAIGLAMDCFAVSIASGILLKHMRWRPMLVMAFFFGFFQALMPLIGWACANTFSHLIEDIDHWIAFVILAFLGGRMVYESFKEEECRHEYDPTNLRVVIMLAIATSIDALAIGVSFAFLGMKDTAAILPSVGVIGFVSFALSLVCYRELRLVFLPGVAILGVCGHYDKQAQEQANKTTEYFLCH